MKGAGIAWWVVAMAWMVGHGQHAWAQNHVFEHLGKTEGVHGNSQYYCFQDSKLKLWFASDHGVAWYDGRHFHPLGEAEGMPDMDVFKIVEDRTGALWFHTMNGVPVRYDGRVAKTKWSQQLMAALRGANLVSASALLPDGSMIFGTRDGRVAEIMPNDSCRFLFKTDYNAVQLIDPQLDGSIDFHMSKVNAMATWQNNRLQKTTFRPLLEDWHYGSLRIHKRSPNRYVYVVANRIAIVERSGDTLRKLQAFTIPQKNIIFAEADRQNDFWIGTNEGALRYSPDDSLFQRPTLFLKGHAISSVCRDHEGGLWFTTGDGIFHCKDEHIHTSTPTLKEQKEEATAIFASQNGRIYLGFKSGKIQEIHRGTLEKTTEYLNEANLLEPEIHRLLDGPNGEIIVVGNLGMQVIEDGQLVSLSPSKIADMAIYRDQALFCLYSKWVGVKLDATGRWKGYCKDSIFNAQVTGGNRCLHCEYDQRGNAWLANQNEVIRVQGSRIDTIHKQYLGDHGFRNTCLRQVRSGQYLYGTNGHGLFVYGDGWVKQLDHAMGLLDDRIVKIFEDRRGIVWIVTGEGLSLASINAKDANVIATKRLVDLFGTTNVKDLIVESDTVWTAAEGGLVVFPVSLMEKQTLVPQVSILGLWANNIPQDWNMPLRLSYDQSNIRIQFHAATFLDPRTVEYRYRISEDDTAYQLSLSQYIELPQLSPGMYQVEIQARHPRGSWSPVPARISLEIVPPFWRTWTFWLAMAILGILLTAIIVRKVLENARRKSALRESLATARQNALINQMNPHFVFNSLNSIQNFILNHETEIANNYLADFASFMRSTLLNGRSFAIPLNDEVKFLHLYLKLEALRLDHKFEFSITVSKGLIASAIRVPTMMLQPLLENSIWHGIAALEGRAGKIDVVFSVEEKYLLCTVTDNGIGRKLAAIRAEKFGKNHQSLATTIMEERLELMNESREDKIRLETQDLVDAQGIGIGTKVILFIPLQFATEHENDQRSHRR